MRPRLLGAVLLGLTFATGGLAGMAVEEGLGLDWFDFLDEDSRPEGRLLDGLDLTNDQEATIGQILRQQDERLEEYWSARLPEMRGLAARSYDEIRAVLTPEQRRQFDQRVRARGAEPLEPPGD